MLLKNIIVLKKIFVIKIEIVTNLQLLWQAGIFLGVKNVVCQKILWCPFGP